MEDILKGNFKVKKPVKHDKNEKNPIKKESLTKELRKKALASLGGSMVYMERTKLLWDGDDE